tara:strand:+ start:73 stop:267 length:195 start_codon:yes stop_codon:yes gene_type:complete
MKFKELSQLSKPDIEKKISELRIDIVKARVTASKGGKVKMKELKKTLARLLMLKSRKEGGENKQ